MNTHHNLVYRPGSDRGALDVMVPDGPGPFPAVVCLHGGGWRQGDKQTKHDCGRLLAAHGLAAVIPNYRLTGTHPHPAQEEDVFAVLDWIAANADRYRLDPHRLALHGTSAGGHLCALVGMKATRQPAPGYTIRCLVPVCGVHDVRLWLQEKPEYLVCGEPFLGGPPDQKRAVERSGSPVAHVHPAAPPCLAIHGQADEVVPPNQSIQLVDALRRVGSAAELILVPGAGHTGAMPGCAAFEPLGGTAAFISFLRRHL